MAPDERAAPVTVRKPPRSQSVRILQRRCKARPGMHCSRKQRGVPQRWASEGPGAPRMVARTWQDEREAMMSMDDTVTRTEVVEYISIGHDRSRRDDIVTPP